MSKKEKMKLNFIGMNADNVTGSMTLIESEGLNILLECGLYQSNDIVGDYKVNNRNLNFSVKKIDFIIVGHVHADHSMLIPRLYAEGCKARIIVPNGTSGFYKLMGIDSAYIIERDCISLEQKYKKAFHRMYTEGDVIESLRYMEEYPMGEKIELSDRLTIRFTPSGHIVSAAQIELWVTNEAKNRTTKILCTSDLGNIGIPKYYSTTFEPVDKANIVEIPVFALDRCPNILTILYDIFGKDPTFKTDIVVDSPLAVKMLKEYSEILENGEAKKLYEVLSWKNVRLISESEVSKSYMLTCKHAVVLSAAGMLSKGRSRIWLKNIIEDERNTILFVGYASENTLAASIKNSKGKRSRIRIDNVEYRNRCKIVDLKSFTSHMQYSDLLDYYSSINADKIFLVHGDKAGKPAFCNTLQEKIDKKGNRTRVVCVNRYMSINL